jgi:hypothetical protein
VSSPARLTRLPMRSSPGPTSTTEPPCASMPAHRWWTIPDPGNGPCGEASARGSAADTSSSGEPGVLARRTRYAAVGAAGQWALVHPCECLKCANGRSGFGGGGRSRLMVR